MPPAAPRCGALMSGTVHCGIAVGGVVVPLGAVTVAKLVRIRTGKASGCNGFVNIAPWPLETVDSVSIVNDNLTDCLKCLCECGVCYILATRLDSLYVSSVGWAIYSSAAVGSSYLASPLIDFHLSFCYSLLMLLKILSMDFSPSALAKCALFFLCVFFFF